MAQFLKLEDAVEIAHREFGADRTLARYEFEQKCYVSDGVYDNGYVDGLCASRNLIDDLIRKENSNAD